MKINFTQMQNLVSALTGISEMKVPFKLGLIIAKDTDLLKKETEFYIQQEREFAQKFLEVDEEGNFVRSGDNGFKIKTGMEQECQEARAELDKFETEVELRMIPQNLLENLELTPNQIMGLELIIEEE